MPYKNELNGNARINEIKNLKPNVFREYLKGIDEQEIQVYEGEKTQIGYSSVEDRICRDNAIHNTLNIRQRTADTFTLKLVELALLFPSDEQWKRFSVGDSSRGEGPLNDETLAYVFDTTVDNVIMKKMLDKAVKDFKAEKGIAYSKKMDN